MTKPIIVIKPGRTEQAAKAAASHTGSLTGSDDVLDAAFRRAGVLRVNSISELFEVSEILAKQPRPRGRKLSIVTNAGGPGVLATDALIGGGGELTDISDETMAALNEVLPAVWSHNNPIDIIGDAPPDRYAKALEIAAADPEADGLLVILTPQAMTDPTATARALVKHARIEGKPVLASWMGGEDVAEGAAILREAGIPTFAYPDTACILFNHLWRYADRLKSPLRDAPPARRSRARRVPRGGRPDHRRRGRGGPDAPHGVRVQEGPRRVRHPDHGHGARPDRGRGRRRCRRDGLPRGRQAPLAHDHAQDGRRRRGPEPARRPMPSARRSRRSATP